MKGADTFSKADCYVKVFLSSQPKTILKTTVVENSSDPVFNFKGELKV